eukprot:1453209-Prymnesium_polylepis.1
MGVIDLRSLRKQGLDGQLATELWVAYLLSQLARRGRCPHFLRLHRCFQSAAPPPSNEWGELEPPDDDAAAAASSDEEDSADEELLKPEPEPEPEPKTRRNARKPAAPARKPAASAPCYQYVTMEFAQHGDMEEACKREVGGAWPAEQVSAEWPEQRTRFSPARLLACSPARLLA